MFPDMQKYLEEGPIYIKVEVDPEVSLLRISRHSPDKFIHILSGSTLLYQIKKNILIQPSSILFGLFQVKFLHIYYNSTTNDYLPTLTQNSHNHFTNSNPNTKLIRSST